MVTSDEIKLELSTNFTIPANQTIGINSRLLFIGSCFSENVGSRFQQLGFRTLMNPFGIIYNPVSIATVAEKIASNYNYTEQELFYFKGTFHSLDHHGTFRNENAMALLKKTKDAIESANVFLKETNVVIITLGSSFVHHLIADNRIVANCHKIPATEFSKRLLTENEIVESLEKACLFLKRFNPNLEIIFTISPVKHLREGIQENALSKARLLSSLYKYIDLKNDQTISYFPAFEIVTEELRDHRFYAEDLAHPSNWTTLYIFRRFTECKLDKRASSYLDPAIRYARMQTHRPMSDNLQERDKWEQSKIDFLEKMKLDFPDKEWE